MAQLQSDKTDSNISNKENIGLDLSPGARSFEENFRPISSFGSGSNAGKEFASLSLSLSGPSSISSLGGLDPASLNTSRSPGQEKLKVKLPSGEEVVLGEWSGWSQSTASLPVRLHVSNLPFRFRLVSLTSGSPS